MSYNNLYYIHPKSKGPWWDQISPLVHIWPNIFFSLPWAECHCSPLFSYHTCPPRVKVAFISDPLTVSRWRVNTLYQPAYVLGILPPHLEPEDNVKSDVILPIILSIMIQCLLWVGGMRKCRRKCWRDRTNPVGHRGACRFDHKSLKKVSHLLNLLEYDASAKQQRRSTDSLLFSSNRKGKRSGPSKLNTVVL